MSKAAGICWHITSTVKSNLQHFPVGYKATEIHRLHNYYQTCHRLISAHALQFNTLPPGPFPLQTPWSEIKIALPPWCRNIESEVLSDAAISHPKNATRGRPAVHLTRVLLPSLEPCWLHGHASISLLLQQSSTHDQASRARSGVREQGAESHFLCWDAKLL